MKIIILLLIIATYGCDGAYPKEDKLIRKAYNDGFDAGYNFCKKECADSDTLGIIQKLWNKINQPKVHSITFKYDSIMIINFDSSEVKINP